MVQVSAVSMLARSVRAKARYSLCAPLRTPSVDVRAAAANQAACAALA